MDILSGLSDDQMALVMCVGALIGCGLMMSLSYYLGSHREDEAEIHIPLGDEEDRDDSFRRAA